MLALLETEIYDTPVLKRLIGMSKAENSIFFSESKILGMDVLRVAMALPSRLSERKTEKRYSALMDALTRCGAYRVCFRDDFYLRGAILDRGFCEPDKGELWRIKAPDIAFRSTDRHDIALVASKYAGVDEEKICSELCAKYRFVALESEHSGAYLCHKLSEKTGISVVEKPSRRILDNTDSAVILDVPRDISLGSGCTVVSGGVLPESVTGMGSFVSECRFTYGGSADFAVPGGYNADAILSEAIRKGKCRGADITVTDIKKQSAANT